MNTKLSFYSVSSKESLIGKGIVWEIKHSATKPSKCAKIQYKICIQDFI